MRVRAQAIIVRDEKMLFAYGITSHNELRHSFIGGGVEVGETPSHAVLRELREEAQVNGDIIFQFSHLPDDCHRTFLVDIGEQECVLGNDPEEASLSIENRSLKSLLWIDLKDIRLFTDIDKAYCGQLYAECQKRSYCPPWLNLIEAIVG